MMSTVVGSDSENPTPETEARNVSSSLSSSKNAERSAFAKRLQQAREAADLSLRKAAREAGVMPSALHSLESGRTQPGLDTMVALLAIYPSLTPEQVTGLSEHSLTGIESGRGAFLAWAEALGLRADGVKVSARGLEVQGLTATLADPLEPSVRIALMRVACAADARVLRQLDENTHELKDGRHLHLFEWSGTALDYRREGPTPLEWACRYPVRELVFQGGRRTELGVTVTSLTGGEDLADHAHQRRRSGASHLALVDFPLVGCLYAASPSTEPWTAPAGVVVRRYRSAAGLKLKDVAGQARVSTASLSAFETGTTAYPRVDSVARLLAALPELPPRRLLPAAERVAKLSQDELFEQSVLVAGVVCDEVEKSVELEPDGTSHVRTIIRGLRSLGRPLHERGLPLPGLPNSAQASPDVLADIADDLEEPEAAFTRTHRFPAGVLTVKWAKRRGIFGATLTRSYEPAAQAFPMTEEAAVERFGVTLPAYSGATLPVHVPAAKASLTVELPRAPGHADVAAHLWPHALFPEMTLPQLTGASLQPMALSETEDSCRYSITASNVPAALKLAIGWRVLPQA